MPDEAIAKMTLPEIIELIKRLTDEIELRVMEIQE